MRERVIGSFLGVAVGDVLGLPHECRQYPYHRVTSYEDNHQCMWSDDTQLTLAVAAAMVDSGGLNLEAQKKRHVEAYTVTTYGWGTTTRNAVKQLSEGAEVVKHDLSNPKIGHGNGVAMKMAPVGAYLALHKEPNEFDDDIAALAALTHPTSMGVSSGLAHAHAIRYCLTTEKFDADEFLKVVTEASERGKKYFPETLKADITERLKTVGNYRTADDETIIKAFQGGSPYVLHSLPFTYAFFLRNPNSVETLYDVASAGGDADTNASMVASLLGALHGPTIFPSHLLKELRGVKMVWDWAKWFCENLR